MKEAERVPVHAPGKARLLRIFIPVALFAAAVLVFTSTPATQISSASTELHESPATGVIFEEELFGDEVDGSTLAPGVWAFVEGYVILLFPYRDQIRYTTGSSRGT